MRSLFLSLSFFLSFIISFVISFIISKQLKEIKIRLICSMLTMSDPLAPSVVPLGQLNWEWDPFRDLSERWCYSQCSLVWMLIAQKNSFSPNQCNQLQNLSEVSRSCEGSRTT